MRRSAVLEEARRRFLEEIRRTAVEDSDLKLDQEVVVSTPLSPSEAIGVPERDDYPILRGREVLMQADYRGSSGQAFTSAKGSFRGSLNDVLEMPLKSAFEMAVLVSTMNSVLRHRGLVEGTVHCKDKEPEKCASCLKEWLAEQNPGRVGLVGMQPAFLEALVEVMGPDRVMVSDLACAGEVRCGVKVLDGLDCREVFRDCDLILATGSTLANGTIDVVIDECQRHAKRLVFYGTTIAGAAYLLGLERWCSCSR
ncbi:MAG: hypothetical protein HPY61_14420 [Methanotrichaceae archaeon]|nr:hypothetical protein [Methanotrichaceae archaeon]